MEKCVPCQMHNKKAINVIIDGVKARTKIITKKTTLAETEIINKRRKICYQCEHIREILNNKYCGYCKCPILEKTKYKDFNCDLGKWS